MIRVTRNFLRQNRELVTALLANNRLPTSYIGYKYSPKAHVLIGNAPDQTLFLDRPIKVVTQ